MPITPLTFTDPVNPYVVTELVNCDDCGGRGWDVCEQFEYGDCPTCGGSKQIQHTHDLLKEAFHIATGRASETPEVRHIQALVHHFRQLVGAMFQIPDLDTVPARRPVNAADPLRRINVKVQNFQEAL